MIRRHFLFFALLYLAIPAGFVSVVQNASHDLRIFNDAIQSGGFGKTVLIRPFSL